MRWLDSITNSLSMNLSKQQGVSGGQRSVACCSSCKVRHELATEQQLIWMKQRDCEEVSKAPYFTEP